MGATSGLTACLSWVYLHFSLSSSPQFLHEHILWRHSLLSPIQLDFSSEIVHSFTPLFIVTMAVRRSARLRNRASEVSECPGMPHAHSKSFPRHSPCHHLQHADHYCPCVETSTITNQLSLFCVGCRSLSHTPPPLPTATRATVTTTTKILININFLL